MPMRPVREDVYDTAPMRPMNIRSGYEGYRRTIDRRREVIRTERPVSGRVNSRKGKKERTSGRTRYENRNSLSALIARQRSAAGKEQYFDYDLLFVIIFLMCLVLLCFIVSVSMKRRLISEMTCTFFKTGVDRCGRIYRHVSCVKVRLSSVWSVCI